MEHGADFAESELITSAISHGGVRSVTEDNKGL